MLTWVNAILEYWMGAPWWVALSMAIAVHAAIYGVGAGIGTLLTERVWPAIGLGRTIDAHPPRPGQLRFEIGNGLVACVVFGIITLTYRELCVGYWPTSWLQGTVQVVAFVVFNNLYADGTHRLLHSRWLIRVHGVHHRSVRVTPWSGYSVHPLEAVVIGMTLPMFMLLVPLGVGTAFVLHALGMLFTTCIHCNYELLPDRPVDHWLRRLIDDPAYHRLHHTRGNVNYGFTSRVMDRLFGTSASA